MKIGQTAGFNSDRLKTTPTRGWMSEVGKLARLTTMRYAGSAQLPPPRDKGAFLLKAPLSCKARSIIRQAAGYLFIGGAVNGDVKWGERCRDYSPPHFTKNRIMITF